MTHIGEAGEIAAASSGHETGATGTDARKTAGIKTEGRVTAETASMSTLARAKPPLTRSTAVSRTRPTRRLRVRLVEIRPRAAARNRARLKRRE